MGIRILLADDHKITRQGLRSMLEKQDDIEVVAEAEDGHHAIELVRELAPDIVIMDVSMPGLNGVEATRQIVRNFEGVVKVIALSMHSDTSYVAEMLRHGAYGYLLKDCAFTELADAIRVVFTGKKYLSPDISGIVVDDYLHRLSRGDGAGGKVLSNREREVLQMVAEGISTKEIAKKLHISIKTVETHRRQIMKKLNIFSVAELTKYAVRKGLTSLDG